MNQQNWVYLGQLTRALQQEGVEGHRAGEFVAEIASHLEETGVDPLEEFGTPFALAAELARRPGSRRPGWLPPLWSAWLVGLVAMALWAVALDVLSIGWSEPEAPLRAQSIVYATALYAMIMATSYLGTRLLDGRSWTALFGSTFVLAIIVGALMVSGLAYAVGEETVITMVPVAAFWATFVLVMPLLVFVLIKRNNPVRFPPHARYLRRLKRGPFAGRPPTKRTDAV
jgi:hypothetical protein